MTYDYMIYKNTNTVPKASRRCTSCLSRKSNNALNFTVMPENLHYGLVRRLWSQCQFMQNHEWTHHYVPSWRIWNVTYCTWRSSKTNSYVHPLYRLFEGCAGVVISQIQKKLNSQSICNFIMFVYATNFPQLMFWAAGHAGITGTRPRI